MSFSDTLVQHLYTPWNDSQQKLKHSNGINVSEQGMRFEIS